MLLTIHKSADRLRHADGLRALSTLAFIGYAFGLPYSVIAGGFLGIDVILTVSAFLVTRHIVSLLRHDAFSLVKFYHHRLLHRILPIIVVTVTLALVITLLMVPPEPAAPIFGGGLSALTFVSNIYYNVAGKGATFFETAESAMGVGYGALGAGDAHKAMPRPLLHVWAIALAEQFYILLALALWLLRRRVVAHVAGNGRALAMVALIASAISFVIAVILQWFCPATTFFELPTRIFQFALASALFFMLPQLRTFAGGPSSIFTVRKPRQSEGGQEEGGEGGEDIPLTCDDGAEPADYSAIEGTAEGDHPIGGNSVVHNAIAAIALVILVLLFIFAKASTNVFISLVVTLATCALLALPNTTVCKTVLSSMPVVIVGQFAFSTYLVHWPVFVFGRFFLLRMGWPSQNILLVVFCLIFAFLLKFFVEDPTHPRNTILGSVVPKRVALIRHIVIMVLLIGCFFVSIFGINTGGFPQRVPDVSGSGWPHDVKPIPFHHACTDMKTKFNPVDPHVGVCRVGDLSASAKPGKYVFFGDSFTEHLAVGLHEIGLRHHVFFDLHFSIHCGFRGPSEIIPTSINGYDCESSYYTLWNHFKFYYANQKSDITLVVSNFWGTTKRLRGAIEELSREVNRIGPGVKLALSLEPPAINERHKNYYACADMTILPIGKIMAALSIRSAHGAQFCMDFNTDDYDKSRFSPEWMIGKERAEYADISASTAIFHNITVFDVFSKLCIPTEKVGNDHFACHSPANLNDRIIYDIGYDRILLHMSDAGSYGVAKYLNHYLYPEQAISDW